MATEVLGAPIKRKEDPRFITGEGNYVDDIKLPGMAYAAVLRSPYAHANIRSIDTSRARTMPGVVGVYTGADFMDYNPLPFAWPAGGSAGLQNNVNMPRVLATDSVKWTGEGVAVVVAESADQAADALNEIEVDYEPLPAVAPRPKWSSASASSTSGSSRTPSRPAGTSAGTTPATTNTRSGCRARLRTSSGCS